VSTRERGERMPPGNNPVAGPASVGWTDEASRERSERRNEEGSRPVRRFGDEAGDTFRAVAAAALGMPVGELWPGGAPLGAVAADEVQLFTLVMALEELNPAFHVPEQLDLRDASLDDLFHFCSVMDEGHHPEDAR
jgi:hypothetical protein